MSCNDRLQLVKQQPGGESSSSSSSNKPFHNKQMMMGDVVRKETYKGLNETPAQASRPLQP
jgi:hypothetical protein